MRVSPEQVDVKQVGRELGVRYVLEGSVRKAGDRLRITGQLIDASTGATLLGRSFRRSARGDFRPARSGGRATWVIQRDQPLLLLAHRRRTNSVSIDPVLGC